MILIISTHKDKHASKVIELLNKKGAKSHLLDLSNFPKRSSISIDFNSNSPDRIIFEDINGAIQLSNCKVVWWRRPQPFVLHEEINSSDDRNFAYTECHAAFAGLWNSLDATWINNPLLDEDACKKVYQLKMAKKIGLQIPDTCVTNNPNRATEFAAIYGNNNVIYKAFSGTERAWRETRLLKDDDFKQIEKVKYAPVILQKYIEAKADLRVTIVNDKIFVGAIYASNTSYPIDFRMVMNEAHMEPFELPTKIKGMLLKLMKRLGLIYGAIDMRLTPNGDYVFLEINPSGQWLFVEERTGLPISDNFAEFLFSKDQ